MIYVQHLMGIGHLRRAAQIARQLVRMDFKVDLVSGGRPAPGTTPDGVTLHQLDPVYCENHRFDRLLNRHGQPVDETWRERRCESLVNCFASCNPDVLLTETYPFGRRLMRFELLPLIKAAHARDKRPLVISSVRDILQPKSKPSRNDEILETIQQYFDYVLVHGQSEISQLGDTFPLADKIEAMVHYTGYIGTAPNVDPDSKHGTDEIIVSGGGGAVALPLLQAAIAARPLSRFNAHTWRLLVGHNIDETRFQRLRDSAPQGIVVERNRSDFPTLLHNCRLSISQAGYNTSLDLLQAGCKAVLVPYAQGEELEQTIRAQLLQRSGRAIVVAESDLSPAVLASAVDAAETLHPATLELNMDGAQVSARYIRQWIDQTQPSTN